jgi:hypothetical protein
MGNSRIVRFAIYFLLACIMLSCVAAYMALEDSPCIPQDMQAGVEDALKVRRLVKRSLGRLLRNTDTAVVYASEEELNSLMLFISRGIKRISGRINVSPEGINAAVCLRLPRNPFGSYINMRIGIRPSKEGISITQASLGNVSIPGKVFLAFARLMLDLFMGDEGGSVLINSVQSLHINNNWAVIRFNAVPELKTRLAKAKERWEFMRDTVSFHGDLDSIRVYYKKLIDLDRNIPAGSVSLDKFLKPLFQFASERGGDPAKENQAALLALSIFLGSQSIEGLIGPVVTGELKDYRIQHSQVVLGNRTDLRMHFLISAALKIISDSGITYALGEFKELADAGRGGSGFSFADLAADRTGVRFAEIAIDSSSRARSFQSVMSGALNEAVFFPDISELPEGLSKAAFEKYYGNVESREYRALVMAIDGCIDRLPAYRQRINHQIESSGGCKISAVMPQYRKVSSR